MGIEMPLPVSGDASYHVRALLGKRELGRGTGGGLCLGAWVPRAVPRDCENPRDFKMPSSASSALPPLRASLSNRSMV